MVGDVGSRMFHFVVLGDGWGSRWYFGVDGVLCVEGTRLVFVDLWFSGDYIDSVIEPLSECPAFQPGYWECSIAG